MQFVKPYNRVDNNHHHVSDIIKKGYKTEQRKTLHEILRPILKIVQFFGILPVSGISGSHPSQLKFTLYSWRCFQSILYVIGMFILGFADFLELIAKGVSFERSGGVIFYTITIFNVLLFMKVAFYWPKLMQEWIKVEHHMTSYPTNVNLPRKLYVAVAILTVLAAIDCIFSVCTSILAIGTCISQGPPIQAYFEIRYFNAFNRTPFEYWKGILFQLINTMSTFVWSFIDTFLIMISMALTELFQRVTNKIKIYYLQEVDESIWINLRQDFNKVTVLCRLVNKAMSELILLSFTSNLCSICSQILHSISPMKNLSAIYFFYSMIFLILRTLYLTLTISKVHGASREPLKYLFQIPKKSYCQDIGRFIQQITSEVIALTGMNFFSVRKGMILSVAGTILTYELVLIQFHQTEMVSETEGTKNISNKMVLAPCTKFNNNLTNILN